MDNSSTMISQSIVDKVDMSQFYGKQQGSLEFNCTLQFHDTDIMVEVFSKILTFKRNAKETEVTILCDQTEIQHFIDPSTTPWISIYIYAAGDEIFRLRDINNHEATVDIKFVQDVNCQVKLTIQN